MMSEETLTKYQVDAQSECIDLCSCGYREVFSVRQHDWWFVKLRHLHNGRTLVVEWKPDYYEIRENRKVLKRVPA